MSVEKFNSLQSMDDASFPSYEQIPFAQINLRVINEMKDCDAFHVWVYLVSKPGNWMVIKQHIKNHFGFGNDRVKKIFKILKGSNLIKYIQNKGQNGQFDPVEIVVLNGSNYINYHEVIEEKLEMASAGGISAPPVSRTSGNGKLNILDINIYKNKDLKDIGQPSVDPQKIDPPLFADFWKEYPRRVKRKKSIIIWKKNKLHLIFDQIISNIRQRNATEWKGKEKKFIPHPTSYLNNEQWNDEILETSHDRKENSVERSFREGLERIKQLQQRSEWEASIVSTQDSSSVDRAALPPF